MMNGSDSSLTTGSTKVDTRPRMSATASTSSHLSWSSALPLVAPSNQMPSSSQAATARPAAYVSSHIRNLMSRH